ncbi:GRP domain-containing protein [Melia azedarach]|uniref:GRP domain-containing protein n=1 Tax=Melia azedarach TaxID=155640 RepID=A0ACC1XQW8_MELAZ|nr:GRP domain-containing protein [Melia azedarach]
MGSKIFHLFGVSTAIFVLLLISSEVGARDLAESSPTTDLKKKAKQAAKVPKGINDAKYGGYGSPFVPGYGTPPAGYGYPPGGPVVPGYPTAPGGPVVPGYPTAPGGPVVPGYPTAPGGGYPTGHAAV